MRVEYINPFVESAFSVLKEVMNTEVTRGEISLRSTSTSIKGVAALIGLAGDVEGRVLFDMTKSTALSVASIMGVVAGVLGEGESFSTFDDMAKATIQNLPI